MRTATLIVLALAAGCATPKVEAGSPRPNVDLPKSERSLRLQLEAAVRDEYGSELYGGTIPVSGWRSTLEVVPLERGFQSAFAGAFKLSDKNADLTVVVAEAELVFAGTAYTRTGKPVSAEAQVRYKARLLDENGTVVRRSAATVASKRSASSAAEVTPVAAGAVESMYEQIAREFFEEAPGR